MKVQVKAKIISQVAILIAFEIVLSRFVSISTPIVKIGFSFLPIALIAILHGPWWAGAAYAIADIIGATLFPIGAYFPGFTLTAFLTGFLFGLFLHNKERSVWRVCVVVTVCQLALSLGLNTVWLMMITGKGYLALFPTRVAQSALMIPIEIVSILLIGRRLNLIKPSLSFEERKARKPISNKVKQMNTSLRERE